MRPQLSVKNLNTIIASVAMTVASGFLIWASLHPRPPRRTTTRPSKEFAVPNEPQVVSDSWTMGSRAATVGVIEYLDLACPYSRRFAKDVFPTLRDHYVSTGKIIFAVKQFPLSDIHPTASQAAAATECAGKRGHFWQMYEAMLSSPTLDYLGIVREWSGLSLSMDGFGSCLSSEGPERVEGDLAAGRKIGVRVTPTFLIGLMDSPSQMRVDRVIEGTVGIETFSASLDQAIARSRR